MRCVLGPRWSFTGALFLVHPAFSGESELDRLDAIPFADTASSSRLPAGRSNADDAETADYRGSYEVVVHHRGRLNKHELSL